MKQNVVLWIVTILLSLVFVLMFIVAMIEKWDFGVFLWLILGGVIFFLLRKFGLIK